MDELPACMINLRETADGWVVELSLAAHVVKALAAAEPVEFAAPGGRPDVQITVRPNLVPAGVFTAATLRIASH